MGWARNVVEVSLPSQATRKKKYIKYIFIYVNNIWHTQRVGILALHRRLCTRPRDGTGHILNFPSMDLWVKSAVFPSRALFRPPTAPSMNLSSLSRF